MRRHYVLFQFKDGTSQGAIDTAMTKMEGMKGQIPDIISLRTGENIADRHLGFRHFLEVLFTDAAAHDAYTVHPVHVAVANDYTRPITERVVALDFDE
jgi:hypothetical protein